MAPKSSHHLDNPPSVSSEEDEELIEGEEEEEEEEDDGEEPQKQQRLTNPKSAAVEDEETEGEEEDEEDEEETPPPNPKKSSVQIPAPVTTQTGIPEPSGESDGYEEEDAESDSDSDRTENASQYAIKPISSKPMVNLHSKPKNNSGSTTTAASTKESKPTPKPAASSTPKPSNSSKRPADNGESNDKDSKRKKSKLSSDAEEVEERKSGFSRLWSEEDEIALLKGVIDYMAKKGVYPSHAADMNSFHEFVKGSLHVDVSTNQLIDKLRRLKKKYLNNAEKARENGEDPVFSRPHEFKSFDLGKKIWGVASGSGVEDDVKSVKSNNNNGSSSSSKARKSAAKIDNSNRILVIAENGKEVEKREAVKNEELMAEAEDTGDFWATYPRIRQSLEMEKSQYLSPSTSLGFALKENLKLIGNAKAKELEEKWKELGELEAEVYVKLAELYQRRAALLQEQTKVALAVMKR